LASYRGYIGAANNLLTRAILVFLYIIYNLFPNNLFNYDKLLKLNIILFNNSKDYFISEFYSNLNTNPLTIYYKLKYNFLIYIHFVVTYYFNFSYCSYIFLCYGFAFNEFLINMFSFIVF